MSASARGLVIHDAETVLREHCERDDAGRTWFVLPGGGRHELITSTADPDIANPGDGSFHPYEPAEVQAAIDQILFPMHGVEADIYLLPYPRRGQLDSAAGPELVFLSPGVRPMSRDHQHAEVVHELGHVVQYRLLPDHATEPWQTYRALRGIQDVSVYSASASHQDRPHEIFAEDFRVLFGGSHAVGSGTIENSTLTPPTQVPGLRAFMLDLAGPPVAGMLHASPNPARGRIRLVQPGGSLVALDLFDVRGRRIASWEPSRAGEAVEWWVDLSGLGVPGGRVMFARPRAAGAPSRRIVALP